MAPTDWLPKVIEIKKMLNESYLGLKKYLLES